MYDQSFRSYEVDTKLCICLTSHYDVERTVKHGAGADPGFLERELIYIYIYRCGLFALLNLSHF